MTPSIFDYHDYRAYLQAYYENEKRVKSGFTYARFSTQAKIKSPNYYKLVIDGAKNLTSENIVRFSKALNLNPDESDYFDTLVRFNQAKQGIEQQYYQNRLRRIKKTGNPDRKRVLEEYEFEAMSNWLHHAVLVCSNLEDFIESPGWIRARLFNLASEAEIATILERLIALKLLVRNKNGRLVQSHRELTTTPNLQRISGRLFYEGLLKRIAQTFELTSVDEREFSTYSVGIAEKHMPELKRRVREFMSSLNDWALANSEPDRIYSLTFAGVPLTTRAIRKPRP